MTYQKSHTTLFSLILQGSADVAGSADLGWPHWCFAWVSTNLGWVPLSQSGSLVLIPVISHPQQPGLDMFSRLLQRCTRKHILMDKGLSSMDLVMAFTLWWLKQVTWLSPVSRDRVIYSTHGRVLVRYSHGHSEQWKAGAVIDSTSPSLITSRIKNTDCYSSSQRQAVVILHCFKGHRTGSQCPFAQDGSQGKIIYDV